MMQMVVTTPNILKHRRPDWLGPFNFFLFPIVSLLGGYPAGFDKSNFLFITPYESDRKKWKSLKGVNLFDGQKFQIAMRPTVNRDTVTPDSFRIVLHNYLSKPEAKSLAPDGTRCTGSTQGLLKRAKITAGRLIPVGKETDRRWEQGEDPSMLDFQVHLFEEQGRLVVAGAAERKRWAKEGVRKLMRKTDLSQKAVYAIITGQAVRPNTLETFRRGVDELDESPPS